MTELDQVPPDQRAVLSLLLRQGKSYGDVASLLHIEPAAVRERAQAALSALGPSETSDLDLPSERREEIADYLLGQQPASQRAAVRSFLEQSSGGRAWARAVAGELRGLASTPLPEIPAEGDEVALAFEALQERTEAHEEIKRSSRRGGAILLLGLGVIVAAVLIVILNSGGGGGNAAGSDSSTIASTVTSDTATSAAGTGSVTPKIEAQINFLSPNHASHAAAVANIIVQGTQKAFALEASGLAPTNKFAYAVWLYNSSADSEALGFINQQVSSNGRASAVGALPTNASHYREIVITRETNSKPTHPGTIVLVGQLTNGG
jgi:hypothetical protein